MKSKTKSEILIFFTIGIFFILSPTISMNFNSTLIIEEKSANYDDNLNPIYKNLKISAISNKIHINNNTGWLNFRLDGNCTGNGTYFDPYVIEDLVIDGDWSGNCILIENSDVFFRIENCTLYYSGGSSYNAGIKLYNVCNALLIDNDCYLNGEGIFLQNSNNNTVLSNDVHDNSDGIYLSSSDNNNVVGNNGFNNEYNSIIISACNDLFLSGNTVNDDGIQLSSSTTATLTGNQMNGCGLKLYGFSTEQFNSHNIDTTNLVNGKPLYYYTNEVNLGSGDFLNAGQIILVNCNNSQISNLNISHTSRAISLHFCHNNEISNNIANNNSMNGIYLSTSKNNRILRNSVMKGSGSDYYGIQLIGSFYNIISENTVSDNLPYGNGISLSSSDHNIVSNNNVSNNYNTGIYISYGEENTISKNTVNDNWNGIYIRKSPNSTISENEVNRNTNGIIIRESNNNEVSKNIVNNNVHGFFVVIYSDNNIIKNNIANNNSKGIYLALSSFNTIIENTIKYNEYGIELNMLCNNNTITENVVIYNSFKGIVLDMSSWNKIFLNCLDNAVDDGSYNQWDNGNQGNYWRYYNATDTDGNGIADAPYNITGSAGSQDRYPLMTCPLSRGGTGVPLELIIIISSIGGASIISVATIILLRRRRNRK